jgi:hypothetical protein
MSCLKPNYNPNPTHSGYRVENRCPYNFVSQFSSVVYNPYLQQNISLSENIVLNQMIAKGNILQYKKNSSNLTKQQKYSQISKGLWVNRTKTYATQSQTYTNPNTNSLKRINIPVNITLNGNPTNLPITCTDNLQSLNPTTTTIINDGGTLLCNSIENTCNGTSITYPNQNYYPTTDSNIPGPVIYLYYNKGLPTYYPRQRYIMNTSLNKWPLNAKGLCKSANSLISINCN